MSLSERVTVMIPAELVREIDRLERNRSTFIQEAARREVERRRRLALRQSLRNPHPDTAALADAGFEEWAGSLAGEDAEGLLDQAGGTAVRWVAGEGWTQHEE